MISAGIELAGRVRPRRRTRGAARLEERAVSIEVVEQLDARLAELARGESGARLVLGEALERLASRAGHFELGFSSLEAYARERCGRSRRWASDSRTLARRLAGLPALRAALVSGAIGWCMAELVARFATPESDGELTRLALGSTVRAMREYFAALKSGACQMSATAGQQDESAEADSERVEGGNRVEPEDLEMVTLSLTVSQQDAWLFAWTRKFAAHAQHVLTDEQVLAAMLAEASSTFVGALPANDQDRLADVHGDASAKAARDWRALRAAWREEADRRCEAQIGAPPAGARHAEVVELPSSRRELDARIQELSRVLAKREVALARILRRFHDVEGWLRLGYSSKEQYARERLGLSPSSYKAKLALARRWGARVRGALEAGEIGYESALLISRVADGESVEAWIARAKERTVKLLAEDVRVAELVRSVGGAALPPSEQRVAEVHALEARILSGDRDAVLEARSQLSANMGLKPGTMRLDLHVTRDTARFWRTLGDVMRKHLPRDMSFLAFLCECFWQEWRHLTERDEKWAHIYARDRYQCQNPLCDRHDVTCHHIVLRSAGGGDEPENLISLCTWCHLEGVHGGRIRLTRLPDGTLRWVLGREGAIVVEGRRRTGEEERWAATG